MTAFIAYVRVSTQKQGQSGLGLEAQHAAVARFVGSGDTVLATYTEVESGRDCQRPQLKAALAHARKAKAVLLIAKLDRLARNVRFLAELLEGDVEIVAADNPTASKFVLQILSCVAENESRQCSERTKAALAAARARGVKLGGWRGHLPVHAAQVKGAAVQASQARTRAIELLPHITAAQEAGAATPSAIAKALNGKGITTHAGASWSAVQVSRVLSRVA